MDLYFRVIGALIETNCAQRVIIIISEEPVLPSLSFEAAMRALRDYFNLQELC